MLIYKLFPLFSSLKTGRKRRKALLSQFHSLCFLYTLEYILNRNPPWLSKQHNIHTYAVWFITLSLPCFIKGTVLVASVADKVLINCKACLRTIVCIERSHTAIFWQIPFCAILKCCSTVQSAALLKKHKKPSTDL